MVKLKVYETKIECNQIEEEKLAAPCLSPPCSEHRLTLLHFRKLLYLNLCVIPAVWSDD